MANCSERRPCGSSIDGGGNADPWGLIAHLHQAVAAYTGSESPTDDVTAQAIKIGDTDESAPTGESTFRIVDLDTAQATAANGDRDR